MPPGVRPDVCFGQPFALVPECAASFVSADSATPGKLVRVIAGEVPHLAVDIRRSSKVILPFYRGLRSRNVMQPWPVAALV